MNDRDWVNCLRRAKLTQKYPFHAIHILAPLRNQEGIAPVVLETSQEYLRAPALTEACFELCLRHLNRLEVPWPADECITVPTLLANRAMEALKLPGRFMPTADGAVLDMCEHSLLAPPSSPRSCMVEHMDLTSTPMLLGNATSRADSPVSPVTLALRAEWPVSQDSPALPGNAALRAESPTSPGNAAFPTDAAVSPGRTANRNVASSMSKKARRRAAFKARKQQQVLRRR